MYPIKLIQAVENCGQLHTYYMTQVHELGNSVAKFESANLSMRPFQTVIERQDPGHMGRRIYVKTTPL